MGQKRAAVMYFTENGRKLAVQVKGLLESPGQGMAVQMGKSPGQSLQADRAKKKKGRKKRKRKRKRKRKKGKGKEKKEKEEGF